jgi:hypothetical protein
VPTLTMFGRVSECTLLDSNPGAVAVEVTSALLPALGALARSGWGCCAVFPTVFPQAGPARSGPRIRSAA